MAVDLVSLLTELGTNERKSYTNRVHFSQLLLNLELHVRTTAPKNRAREQNQETQQADFPRLTAQLPESPLT